MPLPSCVKRWKFPVSSWGHTPTSRHSTPGASRTRSTLEPSACTIATAPRIAMSASTTHCPRAQRGAVSAALRPRGPGPPVRARGRRRARC
jgi:hypothetical protein